MHKAGKPIFRITNGSAFFVLKTFTLNVNCCFIWTLKTVMLQYRMKRAPAVSGHIHTAAKRVLIHTVSFFCDP